MEGKKKASGILSSSISKPECRMDSRNCSKTVLWL